MNKLSIIVPVYKVEPFLCECIESIQRQTMEDYELIIIDDGSPDLSGEIADSYAQKDERIKVIHKENEGVSIARNTGLNIATGEYVIFIDSDDYIEPNFVKEFVTLMDETNADVGMSRDCFNEWKQSDTATGKPTFQVSGEKALKMLYARQLGVAVWNKIYRRSFLAQNDILFEPELWFAEGMTFNVRCFIDARKLVVKDIMGYHQRYNVNSAVRDFYIDNYRCGLRAMDKQRSMWEKEPYGKAVWDMWSFHKYGYSFSILKGIYEKRLKKENQNLIKEEKRNMKVFRGSVKGLDLPTKIKVRTYLEIFFPDLMVYRMIYKEKKRVRRMTQ